MKTLENYSNIVQLILQNYVKPYDLSDIPSELMRKPYLMLDTRNFISVEDLNLNKDSPYLETDIKDFIVTFINENSKLFDMIDKIISYCDKNGIRFDIYSYFEKLDFTFDNFSLDEMSELRKIIKNYTKVLEDTYLAGNGRQIIAKIF